MSQVKTLNGVQYTLPQYNDTGWGANTGNVLTQYMAAIADVTLQLSGGSFTLTADVNFGATYGLVSAYFTSRTSTPATAGAIRLAKTDVISWRNNAAGGNIDLSKDTSDNLKWNATKILLSGAVVNADINAAAAIAYSKLALTGSIVNADINAAAAIAYSKLALTGTIVNADVAAAAAIAVNKLAALTVSRALVSDGSGFLAVATTTATELGYVNGVTSAIQTQLDSKLTNGAAAMNVGASGLAGILSIFPTTASKGKTTIAATDNAGNTTTAIVTAAQSGARTYTVPDMGADSKMLMSAVSLVDNARVNAAGYIIGTVVQSVLTLTTSQDSSSGSNTYTATTATATITPKSTTHKIKITACSTIGGSATGGDVICLTIKRDTTDLSATANGLVQFTTPSVGGQCPCTIIYLDAPASTGALVYKLFIKNSTANRAAAWNNPSQQSVFLVEEIAY